MKMLEEHIMSQDSDIKQYEKEIESRDQIISNLSIETEELRNRSHEIQNEVDASSAMRKKLEDKLRSCRNRMNDAINEQQRLYLQCKENYQEVINSISKIIITHSDFKNKQNGIFEKVK